MIKVIGINGPPRVGKDTLASSLIAECQRPPYSELTVKVIPLKKGLFDTLNLNRILMEDDDVQYEDIKERYPEARQLLINFSEKVIKPIMGNDYFAKYLVNNILLSKCEYLDTPLIVIVPDLGFDVEYDALKRTFGDNFTSVQLRRDGMTFVEDSRYYTNADLTFTNLTLDDYSSAAKSVLNHIGVFNV